MIIYKVTNKINNKIYIGQTAYSLEIRRKKHESMRNISKYHFHNALNKHGPKNFDWEIIYTCDNKTTLNEKEMYYISKYRSNDKRLGYNMTLGGESPLGRKHKESSKIKMSVSKTGKKLPHTDEWNKNIGLAQLGSKNHMYGKTGALHHNSKKYLITLPDGSDKEIIGLRKFCIENDLHDSVMIKVASGERKHHKGFKCVRLGEE